MVRQRSVRRRPFGVRLYLAVAFAAVALITAGLAYLLVSDTGERAADEELTQIAIGRTVTLADEIGSRRDRAAATTLAGITEEGYSAWVFDSDGRLATTKESRGVDLLAIPGAREAVRAALIGSRFVDELPDGVTVVAVPVFREGTIDGALLGRSVRSPQVEEAIAQLQGDRLTALGVAVAVAILVSFLIASAITSRVKRLADSERASARGTSTIPSKAPAGGTRSPTSAGRWRRCAAPCDRRSAPCARSATGSRRSSRRSGRR